MEEIFKIELSTRSFKPKSKIYLFECYIYEEAIGHETEFTRSQPQGYYRLIKNLYGVGSLIYNYKLEFNRSPIQNAQIYDPHQGGKYSLKFVMIRCAEETKLVYRK